MLVRAWSWVGSIQRKKEKMLNQVRIRESNPCLLYHENGFHFPKWWLSCIHSTCAVHSLGLSNAMTFAVIEQGFQLRWNRSFPASVMANALSKLQLILQKNKHKVQNQNIGINCHYCGQLRDNKQNSGGKCTVCEAERPWAPTHIYVISPFVTHQQEWPRWTPATCTKCYWTVREAQRCFNKTCKSLGKCFAHRSNLPCSPYL